MAEYSTHKGMRFQSETQRTRDSLEFSARFVGNLVTVPVFVLRDTRTRRSLPRKQTWGGQSCSQPPFRRLLGHERAFVLGRRPAENRLQPGLAAPPGGTHFHQETGEVVIAELVHRDGRHQFRLLGDRASQAGRVANTQSRALLIRLLRCSGYHGVSMKGRGQRTLPECQQRGQCLVD